MPEHFSIVIKKTKTVVGIPKTAQKLPNNICISPKYGCNRDT